MDESQTDDRPDNNEQQNRDNVDDLEAIANIGDPNLPPSCTQADIARAAGSEPRFIPEKKIDDERRKAYADLE